MGKHEHCEVLKEFQSILNDLGRLYIEKVQSLEKAIEETTKKSKQGKS